MAPPDHRPKHPKPSPHKNLDRWGRRRCWPCWPLRDKWRVQLSAARWGTPPPTTPTTTVAIKRMLIGPQSIFNVGDPMQSCVALVSRAQGGGEGGGGGGGRGGAKGVEWVADEPDARGRERGRGEGGGGRGEKKERKKKQKTVAGRHVQTGQREKRKRSALIGSRSPHAPPPSLATSSGADEVPGRAPRYSTSKRCSTAPLSFVLATHAASSVIMAARWSGRRALGAAAGSGGRSKGFYHLTHHSIIYRPVSSIYAAAGVVTQHIDRWCGVTHTHTHTHTHTQPGVVFHFPIAKWLNRFCHIFGHVSLSYSALIDIRVCAVVVVVVVHVVVVVVVIILWVLEPWTNNELHFQITSPSSGIILFIPGYSVAMFWYHNAKRSPDKLSMIFLHFKILMKNDVKNFQLWLETWLIFTHFCNNYIFIILAGIHSWNKEAWLRYQILIESTFMNFFNH